MKFKDKSRKSKLYKGILLNKETSCNLLSSKIRYLILLGNIIKGNKSIRIVSFLVEPKPSPVWTDETDHQYMRERLPNVYQVFGHTQQESEAVITEQYACLDCRRAFLLTSEGNLIEAETTNKR